MIPTHLGDSDLARDLMALPAEDQHRIAVICRSIAKQTETTIRQTKQDTNGNSLAIMLAAVEIAQDAFASIKGENPIDCKAGCSLCCYLKVEMFPHETYGIASYILAHWSREEVIALYHHLEQTAPRSAGLTIEEYLLQKIPCVFLSAEGRCRVYPVRPINCVKHHSLSLAECEHGFEDPSLEPNIPQIAEIIVGVPAVNVGVLRVLDPARLQNRHDRNQQNLHQNMLTVLRGKILARYGKKALDAK